MKFPIIKIREKGSNDKGCVLGTDERHHYLVLNDNGSLDFFNVQCNDGTGEYGAFEFVAEDGCFGKDVEFGDIYDLINICKEDLDIKDDLLLREYNSAVKLLKGVFEKAENIREEYIKDILIKLFEEDAEWGSE